MSDYASITVSISISEEYVQSRKQSLVKNSEEKGQFIDELISLIKGFKTDAIQNTVALEDIVHLLTNNIQRIWYKYSKKVNITKYSKAWWDNTCHRDLDSYRQSKYLEDWKRFKETVKITKHNFFDRKIDEIANKNCGPWELMSWVKKGKLPATKAIQYNSQPYIKLDNL